MQDWINHLPEGAGLIYTAIAAVAAVIGWLGKTFFKRKK